MTARPLSLAPPRATTSWLVVLGMCAALASTWWSVRRGADFLGVGLGYAAPLDGQEGMALWEVSLLRAGQGFYVPVTPERFVSAPYPPVHPLVLALVSRIDGPHPFWAGRLISVAAGLAVAVSALGLVREVTRSWLAGLIAAALVLSFAPLQLWALRVKPDMLGLAFTVLGLWLAARWRPDDAAPSARPVRGSFMPLPLIAAALAFTLAHFTKQTLLAGPLGAGTYLLIRDWRLALRWGLLLLALVAATWAALDLVTHGQYTYHVWVLHALPWYTHRFVKLVSQLRDMWPLMILGVAGLAAYRRRPTPINGYLLWAPLSLAGAGVVGSNHNHLLETGLALALAGGQLAGFAIMHARLPALLVPALLITQGLLWRAPLEWFQGDFRPDETYTRYIEFIQATPGEVMADDVGLLYAAGRPLRYDDPAAMGPASLQGLWDARRFLADLREGRFSAVIIPIDVFEPNADDPSDRWTPAMLQAIREGYTIKFRDTQIIYAPKAPAAPGEVGSVGAP